MEVLKGAAGKCVMTTQPVHLLFARENTEGEYSGLEHEVRTSLGFMQTVARSH